MKRVLFLILTSFTYAATVISAEIWREGEDFHRSNWPEVALFCQANGKGASGGLILQLFTMNPPAEGREYVAEYEIYVPEAGNYAFWAAISNPVSRWASPVAISIDGKICWDGLTGMAWKSGAFGAPPPRAVLGWINPGSVELDRGRHTVAFHVSRKREESAAYLCMLDGFLLTTNQKIKPPSNYRISSSQPEWKNLLAAHRGFQNYKKSAESKLEQLQLKLSSGNGEVWQEAEDYTDSNWPNRAIYLEEDGRGASGGLILELFTNRKPTGRDYYYAAYDVEIPRDGKYALWAAISNPASGWASPVEIAIDDEMVWSDPADMKWKSGAFGAPPPRAVLGWINPGVVELKAGKHKIEFRISRPRRDSEAYSCFFDGFLLTRNQAVQPQANYRISCVQPEWRKELDRHESMTALRFSVERKLVRSLMKEKAPVEGISDENAAMALKKLLARPLPVSMPAGRVHRIGVHGMEIPLVRKGFQDEKTARAFELLARAGVDTLRTAELCWHRLGKNTPADFDFENIDYQVEQANKYGMNFMFTIGYPSAKFNKYPFHLSTFKPEYESLFREYLQIILPRYNRYAQYWEYANEVDAPDVWWRGATPDDYVRDCRILREEMDRLGIVTPVLGISATYSRSPKHDESGAGQAFTRRCLGLGLEKYINGYSLHYTWQMKEQDFVKFFRELSPGGISDKLVNSEESAFSHPSDVIKLMARDLYLHGFESVYCYLARDRMEGASLNRSGFFDIDWRPKLRLLSLAVAADAMKSRDLVRMAEPADNVEAYLLQNNSAAARGTPEYAIVMWKNGAVEAMNPNFTPGPTLTPADVLFHDGKVVCAMDWLLDEIPFNATAPRFEITERPIVIYCDELPSWPEVTREQWLKKHRLYTVAASEAVIPRE